MLATFARATFAPLAFVRAKGAKARFVVAAKAGTQERAEAGVSSTKQSIKE